MGNEAKLVQTPLIRLSELIERRTGLSHRAQMQEDLGGLLHTLAAGDVHGYLARLEGEPVTAPAWQHLLRVLTVGETYFLRDKSHFHLLRSHILPDLVEKRRESGQRTLNIWSVGCASGEEPYSLAITLYERIPDLSDWQINLYGTDINGHALDVARRGVYRKWAFRHTGIDFQHRYFDTTPNGLQIKPFIRQMVTFRHANLLHGPPMPQMDLILCRNVLMYFSAKHVYKAETLFHDTLVSHGWLLLGHAETLRHHREHWLTHLFPGSPVYQKRPPQAEMIPGEVPVEQHSRTTVTTAVLPTRNRAADIYEDALQAFRAGDAALAESLLHDLCHVDHGLPSAGVLLARIYADQGRVDEAHHCLDRALNIDALLADAHYLRALLYLERGESDPALKSLRATLYCQRNHPLASFVIGNIHAQNGELTQAQRHWENARRAVKSLTSNSPVSDISDMTAGRLAQMVAANLDGWLK